MKPIIFAILKNILTLWLFESLNWQDWSQIERNKIHQFTCYFTISSRMVGFDTKNKDSINSVYLCRSCSLILREPFQLKCGHRQCKTCIENIEGYILIKSLTEIKTIFLSFRNIFKCVECLEETPEYPVSIEKFFSILNITLYF